MKTGAMIKIQKHFDECFEQNDSLVLHYDGDNGGYSHIDVLLYEPTEKYPFWKLATMGASDYKLAPHPVCIEKYNEYIMFVDKDVDLMDKDVASWYFKALVNIALLPEINKDCLSYSHSFGFELEDSDMVGGYICFPQVIETTKILRCKTGLFKKIACLQITLLTKDEMKKLEELGNYEFSYYLYPDDDKKPHYICEKYRTEKF